MTRGSSRGSSRRSLSTTPPRAGSSSTTSPPPCIRVLRHVARLVTRLVAWLLVRLVVNYSTSRRLVVDYFASAAHQGASARRAARHASRRVARRRLLRLAQTRRRLVRLRRASGCLGTSRGSSLGSSRHSSSTTPPCASSSSTTSPTPCVRVPRHVTRLVVDYFAYIARLGALLVAQLIVDYFAYVVRSGASAPRAARRGRRAIFAARLLVGQLHCLSPCAGHSVSQLGYSSSSCTGSTAYVAHSDAPSSLLDNSTLVASTVFPGSTTKSFI
jgi:hypothetical protein